ncbi:MAG: SAM-dependent methyltransferase [Treponema sp.]|jgi:hypothetical protein|nr:SAM-dependent methyltransferase [Treponema sp.]
MYTPIVEELSRHDFGEVLRVVFSGSSGDVRKMTLRPLSLKGRALWQCEKIIDGKAFHLNIEPEELPTAIGAVLDANRFSDVNMFLPDRNISYHLRPGGQLHRKETALRKNLRADLAHDRKKNYILSEGMEIPPLIDLGVFDSSCRVIASKYDKFVQINKFLEIIAEKLKRFSGDELTIIDFGCGKSYLTFIVYYYFTFMRGIKTSIRGYDSKGEVVRQCREIADRYGYSGIEFFEDDVSRPALYPGKADAVITLHACDTATDYALCYALKNKVRFVFSVPCCQQELNSRITFRDDYALFGRYGLYKERFSALLTDCIRCEVLRNYGYDVDVVEFVDLSNTPKNAMIRAELTHAPRDPACAELQRVAGAFNVSHTLLRLVTGGRDERCCL